MSQSLQKLKPYLPPGALPPHQKLTGKALCQIRVSKPRKTKLGDYRRPGRPHQPHRISINGNLNPYAFLITLLHEWAHLEIYQEYKGKVAPHGPECLVSGSSSSLFGKRSISRSSGRSISCQS